MSYANDLPWGTLVFASSVLYPYKLLTGTGSLSCVAKTQYLLITSCVKINSLCISKFIYFIKCSSTEPQLHHKIINQGKVEIQE